MSQPMFKDYRSKHHYYESSGGGLLLIALIVGGAFAGGVLLPMFVEVAAGRTAGAGILFGVVVWLLLLAANR